MKKSFSDSSLPTLSTTTGNADPTISQSFLAQLQALCQKDGNGSKRIALDKDTPMKFDASFFKNVRDGNGVSESDQRLWGDAATRSILQNYAVYQGRGAYAVLGCHRLVSQLSWVARG